MNPIDVDCIDLRFKNPLLSFLSEKKKKKERNRSCSFTRRNLLFCSCYLALNLAF